MYWKDAFDYWISFCFTDGYTRMTLTHLDTPGWLVLTWKPYMEDTPASLGSTWNGHTWIHMEWTHLDGHTWMDTPWWHLPTRWFKIIRYTWKVRRHLKTLNTGAMEPLMDSPRQLLWILPDNSYGFFQTTLMDSSRQLLWILPDNSYGFFQTTLMDSPRSLGSPWPMT